MTLRVKLWDEITDEELLAEGNTLMTVLVRTQRPGGEALEEETWISGGWYENPETHTLSIRVRVRVQAPAPEPADGEEPERPLDEVILVERHVYNADEWVSASATAFVYDPEGMLFQRRQREEQERQQAEMAEAQRRAQAGAAFGLPPGAAAGPPRAQRRQMGRVSGA